MNLKQFVLCKVCQTLHRKERLKKGESAHCSRCGALLYRVHEGLEYKLLTFSLSALYMLLLVFLFPLVQIIFAGTQSQATLLEAIWKLLEQGYPLVSFFVFMVLVIYPTLLFTSAFLVAFFTIVGFKSAAKRTLVALTLVSEWSMLDIFFVAILVAMVKIYEYATILFGVAFWALGFVVVLELYLFRYIGIESFWDMWEERFDSL